jgi:hypothetical protein
MLPHNARTAAAAIRLSLVVTSPSLGHDPPINEIRRATQMIFEREANFFANPAPVPFRVVLTRKL